MKKKQSTLLLRMTLILGILGMTFWGIIRISGYFRQETKPALKRQTGFGIRLPSGYSVHGIDVSKHQETIDWQRVDSMKSAGVEIRFAFIKASEGITRQDEAFRKNWKAVRETGIIRGAYHFYYPSRDAKKQANNFIAQVKLSKGDLPPVVDIEHSNGKSKKHICQNLSVYLKEIEKHYGVRPILYTNLTFYNTYLAGEFDEYPLWVSYYTTKERFTENCSHDWSFWQHSETGQVDGIKGKVDFNVFNGSISELKDMCVR